MSEIDLTDVFRQVTETTAKTCRKVLGDSEEHLTRWHDANMLKLVLVLESSRKSV